MSIKNKNRRSSRREFLKAAGKLAVYTPPAMMVLADPNLVAIARSGGANDTSVPLVVPTELPTELPSTQNWLTRTECGPETPSFGFSNQDGSC